MQGDQLAALQATHATVCGALPTFFALAASHLRIRVVVARCWAAVLLRSFGALAAVAAELKEAQQLLEDQRAEVRILFRLVWSPHCRLLMAARAR